MSIMSPSPPLSASVTDKNTKNSGLAATPEEDEPEDEPVIVPQSPVHPPIVSVKPKLLEIKKMSTQESQESTDMDSLTVDMPTLTISDHDELDEFEHSLALSQETLNSVHCDELDLDNLSNVDTIGHKSVGNRASNIKRQVKSQVIGLVGKVRNFSFGAKSVSQSPSDLDNRLADTSKVMWSPPEPVVTTVVDSAQVTEVQRSREKELLQKECDLNKKEMAIDKKLVDQERKEAELKKKKQDDEDKRKKDEESKKRAEKMRQDKDDEKMRKKEDELKRKEDEIKLKELEMKRKEKELKDEKKKLEEMVRKDERDRKERDKLERQASRDAGRKIEDAAREARELDDRLKAEKKAEDEAAGMVFTGHHVKKLLTKRPKVNEESFENEENDLVIELTESTDLHDYHKLDRVMGHGREHEFEDTVSVMTPQASVDLEQVTAAGSEHTLVIDGIDDDKLPLDDDEVQVTKGHHQDEEEEEFVNVVRRPVSTTVHTDDEMFFATGQGSESEGQSEGLAVRKKRLMTKRLRDTKIRLKNFTSRLCDSSLKGVQRVRSTVSDILLARRSPSPATVVGQESKGRLRREEDRDDEYRSHPDDGGIVSDSELLDDRRSTVKRQQITGIDVSHYEEVKGQPLRPPRRTDSTPNISQQPVMVKPPRRIPPPRPPVPESPIPESLCSSQFVDVPLTESGGPSTPVPTKKIAPRDFYSGIRKDWREKHSGRLSDMLSKSTPALKTAGGVAGSALNCLGRGIKSGMEHIYDCPRRLRPEIKTRPLPPRPPAPVFSAVSSIYEIPRVPRRVSRAGPVTTRTAVELESPYEPVGGGKGGGGDGIHGLPPLPPTRPPRGQQRRLRQETGAQGQAEVTNGSTSPLPSLTHRQSPVSKYGTNNKMRDRPLPAPPLPPPKPSWLSSGVGPVEATTTGSTTTSVSPNRVPLRDAAVSTKDGNDWNQRAGKVTKDSQVQTSLEDLSEITFKGITTTPLKTAPIDENANFSGHLAGVPKITESGTPTRVPSTSPPRVKGHSRKPSDDGQHSITSTQTVGSYYDAEDGNCPDTDLDPGTDCYTDQEDTFAADLDSLGDASSHVYMSADASAPPTPVPPTTTKPPSGRPRRASPPRRPLQESSPTSRSSTRPLAMDSLIPLPSSKVKSEGSEVSEDEDTEEMMELAEGLKAELRQIVERRASQKKLDDEKDDDSGDPAAPDPPVRDFSSQRPSIDVTSYRDGDGDEEDDLKDMVSVQSTPRSSIASSNSNYLAVHNDQSPVTSDACEFEDTLEEVTTGDPVAKRRKKLYNIASELTSTEGTFVDVLYLLNKDFRSMASKHLPDDLVNLQLLPHLNQLANISEILLIELKERLVNYDRDQKIADVLKKYGHFLKQYSLYMKDFDSIMANMDEAVRRYPAFANSLKDFEASDRCHKMPITTYMLKPVQRIPQYRLLLSDYVKTLGTDTEHPDFADAEEALKIVCAVATHANNAVKEGDSLLRLLNIQNNLLINRDLIKPGRVLIKEGDLFKLSRKERQPRHFVLCSDCLMYLTVVQSGTFRLNHEIPLTGMRLERPARDHHQLELAIRSPIRSFIVAANSTKERDEWYDSLNKAINDNACRRSTFNDNKVKGQRPESTGSLTSQGSLVGNGIVIGDEAPVWIPDSRVTMCQICTCEFTVAYRRHHCRACGKVVCHPCSPNTAPLKFLKYRSERVCDECFEMLRKKMESKKVPAPSGVQRNSSFYVPGSEGQLPLSTASSQASSGELSVVSEDGFLVIGDVDGLSIEQNQLVSSPLEDIDYDELMTKFTRVPVRMSGRKPKKQMARVLKEVAANDLGSVMSGYLHVRKSKNNWKRQWYVIKDKVLYDYKASEDVAALSSMPLLGWTVKGQLDQVDHMPDVGNVLFELKHPGQPSHIFKAECSELKKRWIKAMNESAVLD